MNIVTLISSLSPAAQVAFVLGCFTLIFLLACNRKAGLNLITFLRDFCSLFLHRDSCGHRNFNNKVQKTYQKQYERVVALLRREKKKAKCGARYVW